MVKYNNHKTLYQREIYELLPPFTIEERSCLRNYYMEGLIFRNIAKLLGRSPSSISREIARNTQVDMNITPTIPIRPIKSICLDAVFVIAVCLAMKKSLNISPKSYKQLGRPNKLQIHPAN